MPSPMEQFGKPIDAQQGQRKGPLRGDKKEDPWDAMQPIFPTGGGGPTVGDQGAEIGRVLNQGMMASVLGTPGFMTGAGTKDNPYQYHPGSKGALGDAVDQTNRAWQSYAERQGRHNTIKMILDKIFG